MSEFFDLDEQGRVSAREGKTLEFNRDLSSPTKPLRTIAAFANTAGGRLVIGVEDDGTVVGVADPVAEEERVASLRPPEVVAESAPGQDVLSSWTRRKSVKIRDSLLESQGDPARTDHAVLAGLHRLAPVRTCPDLNTRAAPTCRVAGGNLTPRLPQIPARRSPVTGLLSF